MSHSGLIARRASSWRGQWAAAVLVEGGARLLGCLICAVTAAVWLDRAAPLPQGARWAIWSGLATGLGAALYSWIVRPFLSFDWAEVFDAAAARYPEVRESLKAAWELSRAATAPGVSDELARTHVERTERALAALPARTVFSLAPSGRARAAVMAAAASAASWWPLRQSPAWERVLSPWRDVPLERYVAVSPGDAELSQGAAAAVSAQWRPGAPASAPQALELWLRGPEGWRSAGWDSVSGPGATYQVESLTAPLEYRLSWRGLRSRVYTLTPVIVPELESVRVTLQGPQPETTPLSAAQPFSALRGSWLTVTGTPNQPLSKAFARLSSWPVPLAMKTLPGGDWQVSFALREDCDLSFELEGERGLRNPHPGSYRLKAVADEPPQIQLLSPAEPITAGPRDSIPLTYAARDDGGLARISLLVWPAGKAAQETALELPGGRREVAGDAALDLSDLGLGRVEFQLKAVDNARPAQAGFSAKGVIDVVDLDAAHSRTEAGWLKAESSLKALGALESRAQALAAARSGELAGRQAELSQAWSGAAADMQALAAQMASDAYANPGLADQAKASAQGLAESAARRVPAADAAAKRGDFDAAAREHERLGRQVEAARRLLEEGRKIQGLQDVYSETGRMSQSAQSLQSALEAPASTGKAIPREQLEKLQRALGRLEKQMDRMLAALSKLPKAQSQGAAPGKQYQLPLEAARQSAGELANALASGDYAKAERLAEKLADQLSQVERGLEQAAQDAASSGPENEAARKLDEARGKWSELVDEQTRVIERTQKLEDERVARTLDAQRDLLAELERRQSVAVSSAQAMGASFPQDALGAMRQVQAEFASRRISRSAQLLPSISARLRSAGRALEPLASEEDDIRRRLQDGAQAKAESAGAQDASRAQQDARQKTRGLEQQLQDLDVELPGEALEGLQGAQSQQRSAEESLGRQDSSSALPSEQKALEMLEQGAQKLSEAAGRRQQMQSAMSSPFQRRGPGGGAPSGNGAGGRVGAQMTFVPLPSARDYRPAPEIRKELEKSLREPRPASFDGIIKEYFKRIAQ